MSECSEKIQDLRRWMAEQGADAVRLRSVDWFAWATGGGDSAVSFSKECGVGEVLVTRERAFVLTSRVESPRLREEQVPKEFEVKTFSWVDPGALSLFAGTHGKKILCDRPAGVEFALGPSWARRKWELKAPELERYRSLGRDAASAASEALQKADPTWTEWELAGAAASSLWRRGIHPILTLVAGEERIFKHRHPVASGARLRGRAMLVVCGRRNGLYANFSRHVFFRAPRTDELEAGAVVLKVEEEAMRATAEGLDLNEIYIRIRDAYQLHGHGPEIDAHHQGGPTGYLSREALARPGLTGWAPANSAVAYAWNPSLPGAKIEDTVVRSPNGSLEILTRDPEWPALSVGGMARPGFLVRG